VSDAVAGSESSRVPESGDRSSWKQQALWLMEPTSHRDGLHASMLSPLSPVVSPSSQSHSDKVINEPPLFCFVLPSYFDAVGWASGL